MASEQLLVTLGVQDKGATTQIRALNKELKSLDTQYNLTAKSGNRFDESLATLNKKLSLLEQKYAVQTAKLNTYKNQIETVRASISKKTEELEKLKNSQEDNTAAIAKTEKQLNTYRSQLKNAENGVKETELQLELLTEEINNTNKAIANFDTAKMSNELKESGQNLDDLGGKLEAVGGKLNSAGNTLIGLSAPIVAFAGYATKAGIDFEQGMAKVQAISGATGNELELLTEKAKEIGESTQWSSTQAAEGLQYLSLAGWDTQSMLAGITPIVNLATASTENLGTVSDIVSDALTAFGLSAKDAEAFCDVLASTVSNSNTNVAMLGETFQYAAPLAGALGFSMQDVALAAGLMANAGIKASVSGTALRTLFANMGEKIELTGQAFDKTTISTKNQDGTMRNLNDIIVDLRKSFQQMTEAEKTSNAEVISGKTGMAGLLAVMNATDEEFNSLRNNIINSTGATQKMADVMGNTTQGKVNAFKSKLEALGIQLADNLLPHVNAILDKGIALIDWFSSLDEETQKTIISTGLFATATGGALKIIGGLASGVGSAVKTLGSFKKALGDSISATGGATKGIGSLVTGITKLGIGVPQAAAALGVLSAGIYTYNEYQDSMSKKVNEAKEDMSLLERAFLMLSGAEVKSKDELVNLGIVYDDFNSNISSSFQDAVKEMTSDVNSFNLSLRDMNLDGVISDNEVNNVLARVGTLVDGIENTIKSNSSNVQNALYEMYNSDGVIDETEANLLAYWNNRTETEVNKANDLENAIKDILNQAKGRELTNEEITSIQNYYAQLKQLELELQADNSYELEYAKSEFQNRIKTLDAEGAQELLQQRYKQYEDERISIESHYDAMIAQVQAGNTELTEEDQKLIADMEAKKQEKLAVNQQYWDEAYNYTISANENLVGVINKFNGEILQSTDKNYYDRYVLAQQNLQGLNEITETGYQTMLDITTGKYVDMYAVVNEKTGQLQGLYNLNTGAVSAMSSESAKEIEKLYTQWATSSEGIVTKNLVLQGSYLDTSNNIVTSNGKIIGSLGQVQDKAGNLQSAILDLNGNPIVVGDNAKEVIEKLQNTKREVNSLDGSTATVKVDDAGSINSFGSRLKNMFSNIFGGGKSYAIGTNNAPQGIHTVNEKGWELIDAPRGKNAVGLGENAIGETAYLPRGTKVRTNLSSTELMMKEIKKEVSSQISKIDFSHQYYKPPQVQTRVQETTAKVSNNSDNELLNRMNTMITLLAQLVNKDTDIYIDSRKVGKTLATVVDEQIAKRARGRI